MATGHDQFFGAGHGLENDEADKTHEESVGNPIHTSETKRVGFADRIKGALKGSFSQMADSLFQAKDQQMDRLKIKEDDGKAMKMGKSLLLAGGIIAKTMYDTVASVTAVKVVSDLPLSVLQNAVVKNRKGEMKKLFSGEAAFEEKKSQVESLLTSSSAVKKLKPAELAGFHAEMARIHDISDEYGERGEAFEALIDNYLQAKTSAMSVVRSGLNAAFLGAGMNMVRGVTMLSLKGVETYQESKLESERSKAEGQEKSAGEIFRQKLIAGTRNTLSLGLSSAKENRTKMERVADTAKAVGTIFTFFGIAHAATSEMEHAGISENITKSLHLLKENGWGQIGENFTEGAQRAWQTYRHPVDTFTQMQTGVAAQWNRWFGSENSHKIDALQRAGAIAYGAAEHDGIHTPSDMSHGRMTVADLVPGESHAEATMTHAELLSPSEQLAAEAGAAVDLDEIKIVGHVPSHHGGSGHNTERLAAVHEASVPAAATIMEAPQASAEPLGEPHVARIRPIEQFQDEESRRFDAREAAYEAAARQRAATLAEGQAPAAQEVTGVRGAKAVTKIVHTASKTVLDERLGSAISQKSETVIKVPIVAELSTHEALTTDLSHYGMKLEHASDGNTFSFHPSREVANSFNDHRMFSSEHPFINANADPAILDKVMVSQMKLPGGNNMGFNLVKQSYQIGVLENVASKMPAGADRDSVLGMKNTLMKGLEKMIARTPDVIDQDKVKKMIAAVAKNPDKFRF